MALYNFRLKHKDVDIEPFLEQTSDFFQKYIARGLKTIEDERKIDNTGKLFSQQKIFHPQINELWDSRDIINFLSLNMKSSL